MKLEDILRKIFYREEPEEAKRDIDRDYYNPQKDGTNRFRKIEGDIFQQQKVGAGTMEDQEARRRKIILISFISFAALLFLGVVFLVYLRVIGSSYSDDKVTVQIEGEESLTSPARVSYKVKIKNSNATKLNEVSAFIEAPTFGEFFVDSGLEIQNSRLAKKVIGDIGGKSSESFDVTLDVFSPQKEQSYLKVRIEYKPKGFSSFFSNEFSRDILVNPSPISLQLSSTGQASSGEKIELEALIKNNSNQDRRNVSLEINYPNGFIFNESDPSPTGGENVWSFGDLAPGAEKKVKIEGLIEGLYETSVSFQAKIKESFEGGERKISQAEAVTRLVADRVIIMQKASREFINVGEDLHYDIYFRNSSPVPLRDLILTTQFSSALIDKSRVSLSDGGYYDSKENKVTWKASDVAALKVLEPNQEGKVSVYLNLKGNVPIENKEDKNFKIIAQSEIHSLDLDSSIGYNKKILSQQSEVLLNSAMVLGKELLTKDDLITTEGPLPLEVGKETTLVVKLSLKNKYNDLKNVGIKLNLPTGVSWKGKIEPSNSGVEFNERTNELNWLIGPVAAHTGYLTPSTTLAFKVGIIPSENQIGKVIPLLSRISVAGEDSFTGRDISFNFPGLSSSDIPGVRNHEVVEGSRADINSSDQENKGVNRKETDTITQ